MKLKQLVVAGAVLALSVSLSACASGGSSPTGGGSSAGGAGGGQQKTIVFVPKVSGNSFFDSGNVGAQAMGAKAGFKVVYNGSPTASPANQVSIINSAVQTGAAGIVISSTDPTALDNALKQAMAAGVAVVTWDSDVSPDARTVMVSQGTPSQLGQMLVDMSVDALKQRGLDPATQPIKFAWHYSSATVTDQNSWVKAANEVIAKDYPNWVNVQPSNFYSNQDAQTALSTGESILKAYPDIDLIMCPDSTALPGQLQALQNAGKTKTDVTVTGFSTPNSIKQFATNNIVQEWGLWDVQVQAGIAVYLANYLASGNTLKVGDSVDVPDIGTVQVQNNSVLLTPTSDDSPDHGVVLLPERTVFTTTNMDQYNF